jgi:transposase
MLQHLYGIYLAADTEEANQALGAFAFHTTDRATNGRIEGTNNKIGVLKRVAYGFINVTNLAARAILLTPGMAT